MKRIKFLVFVLILLTGSVHGQSIIYDLLSSQPDSPEYSDTVNSIDSSFKKCDSTWVSNLEWGTCINSTIALWDTCIKETYDTLMEVLDTTGQRLLKQSQINWRKSITSEDDFSNHIMDVGSDFFGREDYYKRFYSDLYTVRGRAMELKSCLRIVREAKKGGN